MHPKDRLWRQRCVPSRVLSIEKVDIPCRAAFYSQELRIGFTEGFVRIPVVAHARVGDERRSVADVGLARSQFRNPDEEGCEIFRGDPRENVALNFERPSKTERSSRADEHDHADAARGCVEGRA